MGSKKKVGILSNVYFLKIALVICISLKMNLFLGSLKVIVIKYDMIIIGCLILVDCIIFGCSLCKSILISSPLLLYCGTPVAFPLDQHSLIPK